MCIFGWIVTIVILVIAGCYGLGAIEQAIRNPKLDHGIVTNKAYNDGHYWYSSVCIGDYSISKRYGGESYYYVTVSDGAHDDFWTVTEDEWVELRVGDYVQR